jgi:hypothetical protein
MVFDLARVTRLMTSEMQRLEPVACTATALGAPRHIQKSLQWPVRDVLWKYRSFRTSSSTAKALQVNPVATLLMMAAVAMVIVFLYGELWILGMRFNECAQNLCDPLPQGTRSANRLLRS